MNLKRAALLGKLPGERISPGYTIDNATNHLMDLMVSLSHDFFLFIESFVTTLWFTKLGITTQVIILADK